MKSNYNLKSLNNLPNYHVCIMPRNYGKTHALNSLNEKQLKRRNKIKFRHYKRLLKDLVKYDYYHIFTPYKQRCIDETIRMIKLSYAYEKAHKRNKGK